MLIVAIGSLFMLAQAIPLRMTSVGFVGLSYVHPLTGSWLSVVCAPPVVKSTFTLVGSMVPASDPSSWNVHEATCPWMAWIAATNCMESCDAVAALLGST